MLGWAGFVLGWAGFGRFVLEKVIYMGEGGDFISSNKKKPLSRFSRILTSSTIVLHPPPSSNARCPPTPAVLRRPLSSAARAPFPPLYNFCTTQEKAFHAFPLHGEDAAPAERTPRRRHAAIIIDHTWRTFPSVMAPPCIRGEGELRLTNSWGPRASFLEDKNSGPLHRFPLYRATLTNRRRFRASF